MTATTPAFIHGIICTSSAANVRPSGPPISRRGDIDRTMSANGNPAKRPPPLSPVYRPGALPQRQRLAVVKGQDFSRYTDFYHTVLRAPWWLFFVGLAAVFVAVNAVFAFA